MSIGLQISKARSASALVVEELARVFGPEHHPESRLAELGISSAIADDILVVKPAQMLEDFRFVYSGDGINSRFGMNLTGQCFAMLLRESDVFLPCLQEFKDASDLAENHLQPQAIGFFTELDYRVLKNDCSGQKP